MSKEYIATAKVVPVLYRPKSDGTIPLYLRVTYRGNKKEYSLKISVIKSEFNFKTNRYKKNQSGNITLNAKEEKAVKIISELENFSFYAFEEKLFGADVKDLTVIAFLEQIIKINYDEGRIKNGNTFRDAKSAVKRFKGENLKFSDITPSYLKKLEAFLRKGTKDKKGAGTATIGIYFRALRTAYNVAIKNGLVKQEQYPFKEYTIKTAKGKSKFALTKDEMIAIMKYPTKEASRLRDSQNYFILSYLCRGMNFNDLCRLTWNENITGDRITYLRGKTARTENIEAQLTIKITDKIAAILSQYSKNEPFIFPVFEPGLTEETKKHRINGKLKLINEDLRLICKELNIKNADKIVFMVARHTYATVLNESGVNLTDISESLGHSSLKTTENYLHSITHKLDKNDEFLV